MEFRSAELPGHFSFLLKFGTLSLHHSWASFDVVGWGAILLEGEAANILHHLVFGNTACSSATI